MKSNFLGLLPTSDMDQQNSTADETVPSGRHPTNPTQPPTEGHENCKIYIIMKHFPNNNNTFYLYLSVRTFI